MTKLHQQKGTIKVVSFDPSLLNWGITVGLLDLDTGDINITQLSVICPAVPDKKDIRVSSRDLDAATQLAGAVLDAANNASLIFVEMPQGSQNSRGAASYGICVGILGMLNTQGIPVIQLTPTEIKLVTGNKNATKSDMVNWFNSKFPNNKLMGLITPSKRNHAADSTAALFAGLETVYAKTHINLYKGATP